METAESKVNGFWVGMLGRWFPFPAYILAAEARSETANTKSGGGRIDITVTRMRDRHVSDIDNLDLLAVVMCSLFQVILHLEGKHDDKVEVIPQLKGYMESAMKVGEDLFGMAVSGRSVQFLGAVEDPTGGMKVVSFVARGGELVQSTQGNGNGAGEWYELGGAHHWAIIGEALRYIAVKTE